MSDTLIFIKKNKPLNTRAEAVTALSLTHDGALLVHITKETEQRCRFVHCDNRAQKTRGEIVYVIILLIMKQAGNDLI